MFVESGVLWASMLLSCDFGLDGRFCADLCGLQCPSGSEQLEQIADRAHQSPLTANIPLAAQAEAAEAASFLDLSEDRLNDCLAHLVDRTPCFGPQFVVHLFTHCRARRHIA